MSAIQAGKTIIAAHHYQRPEIVARAGLLGDSYRLAVEAARTDAEFIVLCGVLFMAESAAILAREGQTVLIPDMNAGCPMADMIDRGTAADILGNLKGKTRLPIVPITYMNSHADVKALTGEWGGSVCTSGNARKILSHFLDSGNSIFFMPDYNLGMNTARSLGIGDEEIQRVTADGSVEPVGGAKGDPESARIFLWDGFCHVHKAFAEADVERARKAFPEARIIVHPECSPEVVARSDASGSTEAIYKTLRDSSVGSIWIIGTEGRFVERMAAEFPDRKILPLRASYCHNMNKIDPAALDRTLDAIANRERGKAIPGTVTVTGSERKAAADALNAMVRITEEGK